MALDVVDGQNRFFQGQPQGLGHHYPLHQGYGEARLGGNGDRFHFRQVGFGFFQDLRQGHRVETGGQFGDHPAVGAVFPGLGEPLVEQEFAGSDLGNGDGAVVTAGFDGKNHEGRGPRRAGRGKVPPGRSPGSSRCRSPWPPGGPRRCGRIRRWSAPPVSWRSRRWSWR